MLCSGLSFARPARVWFAYGTRMASVPTGKRPASPRPTLHQEGHEGFYPTRHGAALRHFQERLGGDLVAQRRGDDVMLHDVPGPRLFRGVGLAGDGKTHVGDPPGQATLGNLGEGVFALFPGQIVGHGLLILGVQNRGHAFVCLHHRFSGGGKRGELIVDAPLIHRLHMGLIATRTVFAAE